MDRDVQRLLAHADQTRATMRDTLAAMSAGDKAALIRTCARGDLANLDERTALFVGLLAVVAIFDLNETRGEVEP
ncbi:MAG: hypothetical protein KJZ69_09405 [Phycisphaerales bacterium]|nr:hypothetical protein [Phycisphaerales bacterium]